MTQDECKHPQRFPFYSSLGKELKSVCLKCYKIFEENPTHIKIDGKIHKWREDRGDYR